MSRRLLRAAGRIAVGFLTGLPLALVLTGAGYQAVADARDRRAYPPPGRLVDVGGYRLHLDCRGAGSPTVVLEAARGRPSLDWLLVAPELAGDSRVCAYDRAGLGWSDPGPEPRTAEHLAAELHALLRSAGGRGPYVLVSDGRGAHTVRLYAARHPEAVAGAVLVDPVPDEQFDRLDVQPLWLAQTAWVAGALGIPRLKGGWTRHPPFPPEAWPVVTALGLRTAALRASAAELAALEASAAQVRAARGAFPPVPLVVVTPAPPAVGARRPAGERYRLTRDLQATAARLSPRGAQVIADTGTGPLPLTAPATVASAVREALATAGAARG